MKALVVGGSLGGLFAANLLHRAGWEVLVCERAGAALSGRGAGLVSHPALFAALAAAGVAVDPREPFAASSLGVFVPDRRVFSGNGDVVAVRDYPQVLASWSRLYELLRAALPQHCYRHGAHCIAVASTAADAGAVARFANGAIERADLLVAADGIRSPIRAEFAPSVEPIYAGYIAWRGLVTEAQLARATWHALGNTFGFCLPDGEQMLGYPVRVGSERAYNFVWYRPASADDLRLMLTDADGHVHTEGIAPPRICPELISAMRIDATARLAPAFADVVNRTEQPFFQPITDLVSERMVFGRTVLLGDAAFVARPHVGMGVTKAADDACALVAALRDAPSDINLALANYERARVAVGRAVVERGRALGAYMQGASMHDHPAVDACRTPEQVLAQTAIAL